MSKGSSILIVDDEANTRKGLRDYLEAEDYAVFVSEDGETALDIIKKENPDVILADIRLPGMDGHELLKRVKKLSPSAPVIMLTAYGTVEGAVKAMSEGAFNYLTKPVNLEELEHTIEQAIEHRNLKAENIELRKELDETYGFGKIIGQSKPMKELFRLAKQVAESNATCLIQGESGTGKELLAHLIHELSPRKTRPFIVVHCASLTETLLASELFGHEKGAFTGATERKIGRFERAHEGTVFLDEIGEVKEEMQVKLLRVLQEGEFERVGSARTIKVDIRLICATNKNLAEEVKKGNFREDLFYRINVILLEVPPLRARKEDIPLLVNHFVDHYAKANNKEIKKVTPEAMKALEKYDWPGNVRELKNIVERMVVLARNDIIGIDNIPSDIKGSAYMLKENEIRIDKGYSLQQAEKELIQQKLLEAKGNKSLAAKSLGISRRTLYRKMEEYKIDQ